MEEDRPKKTERKVMKKSKSKGAVHKYSAVLTVVLNQGTKTFATVTETVPLLKDTGIDVKEDRMERLQSDDTERENTERLEHCDRGGDRRCLSQKYKHTPQRTEHSTPAGEENNGKIVCSNQTP